MHCYLVQDEKELLDNNCCPVHLKPCVSRKEDNYFFALSKYQKALEETLNENPNFVQPSFRLNEVRQWGVCFSLVFLSVTFWVWCTLCCLQFYFQNIPDTFTWEDSERTCMILRFTIIEWISYGILELILDFSSIGARVDNMPSLLPLESPTTMLELTN